MADQVDEVKQKTDIVSLISGYITLKKAGRNYKANCPFHGEKTPSFMVSPELQIYKCFGCQAAGDCFTFLEQYEGMEFPEALRFLAEKAGVKLESFRGSDTSEKERLYELNNLACRFYHYVLLNHPAGKVALNYLVSDRKIKPETIKTFQLGYAPETYGALKSFLVDKKKFLPQELEKAGLGFIKGREIIDKFRGRVIFPLFDHRGNVAGFAGRIMPGPKANELAKYINTPETPVYHKSYLLYGLNLVKSDIKLSGQAIVVEGELDMISSWQAGIKNVVAIKGSALTDEQVRLIFRFTKKIILALDSDFAGDAAARRGIVVAQKAGLDITVARMGKFKDPDDAAKAEPEYYKKALTDAVGVWDFILDSIFAKADTSTGEGKSKVSSEVVPVLASIPDKIVQAHYCDLVARRLGVPPEAVSEEIARYEKDKQVDDKTKQIIVPENIKSISKSRRQLLEERLSTLAFRSDPSVLLQEDIYKLVEIPLTKRILAEYKGYSAQNKNFSLSGFAQSIPKELVDGYSEMTLKDLEGLEENKEELKKELDQVIKELKILSTRHHLEELGAKIRKMEEIADDEGLKSAQSKFSELSKTLSRFEEEDGEGIILSEE
jgi:DNA primase